MNKKRKKDIEREVDAEFEAKTKEELLAEFAHSQALFVPAKKRVNKLISIRLPIDMIKQLHQAAAQTGDLGYQQMIKILIAEGLSRKSGNQGAVSQQADSSLKTSADVMLWPSAAPDTISAVYGKVA